MDRARFSGSGADDHQLIFYIWPSCAGKPEYTMINKSVLFNKHGHSRQS